MNQVTDKIIVLSRVDYGERDRILTVLGRQSGKASVLAKGVRAGKSKLAGGIELFSENTVCLTKGRGELYILTSSRLDRHFQNISKDLNRTMLGYDFLKTVSKLAEDGGGEGFYGLLVEAFTALDDLEITKDLVELWFSINILHEIGSLPNLATASNGSSLEQVNSYSFDYDSQCFVANNRGNFTQNHIKFLRLIPSTKTPQKLMQVKDIEKLVPAAHKLFYQLIRSHV